LFSLVTNEIRIKVASEVFLPKTDKILTVNVKWRWDVYVMYVTSHKFAALCTANSILAIVLPLCTFDAENCVVSLQ